MPSNKEVKFKYSSTFDFNSVTKDSGTFYLVKDNLADTKAKLYLGGILLIEIHDVDNIPNTLVKRNQHGDIKITKGIESPDYEMKYDDNAKAIKFIFK